MIAILTTNVSYWKDRALQTEPQSQQPIRSPSSTDQLESALQTLEVAAATMDEELRVIVTRLSLASIITKVVWGPEAQPPSQDADKKSSSEQQDDQDPQQDNSQQQDPPPQAQSSSAQTSSAPSSPAESSSTQSAAMSFPPAPDAWSPSAKAQWPSVVESMGVLSRDRNAAAHTSPLSLSLEYQSGGTFAACLLAALQLKTVDCSCTYNSEDGETHPENIVEGQWTSVRHRMYQCCWALRQLRYGHIGSHLPKDRHSRMVYAQTIVWRVHLVVEAGPVPGRTTQAHLDFIKENCEWWTGVGWSEAATSVVVISDRGQEIKKSLARERRGART